MTKATRATPTGRARASGRSAVVDRTTRETEVHVALNIDGGGAVAVDLPDRFFRHMVETFGRYAGWDLTVTGRGDLDHHLMEDVAICMGRAFRKALGENPAVERIADARVPFDEALVAASVDIVERPYIHAELPVPQEMYEHFLRSFVMDARVTLHIEVLRGKNHHHIIEGAFKAAGIALRKAVRPRAAVISMKGAVAFGRRPHGPA